jgi:hypothetical protein
VNINNYSILGSLHSQNDQPEEQDYVSCTESETNVSNDEEEEHQPKTITKQQPTIEVDNVDEKKQRTVNFNRYEAIKQEDEAAAQEKRKLINRRRQVYSNFLIIYSTKHRCFHVRYLRLKKKSSQLFTLRYEFLVCRIFGVVL